MGRFGTASAEAQFCALEEILAFAAFAGSRARSKYPNQDMPIPFAAARQHLRLLVRCDRKSQLGIGRRAGWATHLSRATEYLHNFSGARLANSRRGRIKVGDSLRINPRRIGPQARSQTSVVASFSIPRGELL